MCLSGSDGFLDVGGRSSFHVWFEHSGVRTPQCTLLGSLNKPEDESLLKKLCARWEKKFGEEVNEDLVYVISVDLVLQIDDFKEEGIWVTSSEYGNADPDPLRNYAQSIVTEKNLRHAEDVLRLCNGYVDSEFEGVVTMVSADGFDIKDFLQKAPGVDIE